MTTPRSSSRTRTRAAGALLLGAGALGLGGCLERTIEITSEPPGATVYLNDVELGQTPVSTAFTFHGSYDVRLHLEGYEPIETSRVAHAPVQEWPGIDLVAEALPVRFSNTIAWHFDMAPALERAQDQASFTRDLIARAQALRLETSPPKPPMGEPVEGRPLQRADADQSGDREPGRAGTPTTVEPGGTSDTTTAPAPTTLP